MFGSEVPVLGDLIKLIYEIIWPQRNLFGASSFSLHSISIVKAGNMEKLKWIASVCRFQDCYVRFIRSDPDLSEIVFQLAHIFPRLWDYA